MKKTLVLFLLVLSFASYAGDAWCKVSVTASENQGWCAEGMDGKGKCLAMKVEGANKCSDDQPEGTIGF